MRKHAPFLLALAIIAADQLSKHWLLFSLGLIQGRAYEITSFFNLVMVWNSGVSFGLFNDGGDWGRWALFAMASTAAIALSVWLTRTQDPILRWGLPLIIGGALGNAIDRIRFGAVADFFDFHIQGYHWPAFNIADSAICVGVALLLIESIVRRDETKSDT